MNNIDRFMDAANRMLDEEEQKKAVAANEKALYGELKEQAADREKAARATIKELELAKLHAEKAQGTYASGETLKADGTVRVAPQEEVVYVENETTKKSGSGVSGFIAGAAVVLLLAGGWKLYKEAKEGNIELSSISTKAITETATPEAREAQTGDVTHDYANNEAVVITEAPVAEVETPIYEELTNDNFEYLVATYADMYNEAYAKANVSTEDITEFVAIATVDLLAEENPELLSQIAAGQTKEEFLNDAAKVIGASVMHNFTVWNATHSTEGFIRVSDAIYGEQREQMKKIEEYTDRIAAAVNQGDKDLVNQIVSEFLTDLNSGSLSKLDDGVGFVAQVNIATIADGIARNYLNKENFDMFQILKTSEKYVSNIFTVIDRCAEETKTYSR